MCIAVPDTCILAESNQLIKYSSPSNSQSEALKQKSNTLSLSVMQHKLVGHFLGPRLHPPLYRDRVWHNCAQ